MSLKEENLQKTCYVAPMGNDNNPGTESKPFKTIEKAREVVRSINKDMIGDIVVLLRRGTYAINRTIIFEHRDSGTNGYNVVYRSYPGETVVVSGGKRITGWQPDSNGCWKASVDIENFRQLYVNGTRAVRAMTKVISRLEAWGLSGYRTANHEMAEWGNQGDIEFCYYDSWCHTRCKVNCIKRNGPYSEISMLQPYFTLAKVKEGRQIEYPAYIENAFEFLAEPGQWYLNRTTHMLYYIPRPNEDMETTEVIAPVLERLIELKGMLDMPVHNIQFDGITFAHATWLGPSETGLIDVQANFTVGPDTSLLARKGENVNVGISILHGECIKSPSNIVCHAVKSVRFVNCKFTKLGGGGIDLEYGAQDNVISGCEFYDISGTAIQIGDVLRNDHHPEDVRAIVKNNTITDNYLHDVAVEYKGGVGIFVGYTDGMVITHNEISNLPYSGISVGWGWGEVDAGGGSYWQPFYYDIPTPAKNNRIEYNHIHHVMLTLDDGGGIYTLCNMPGTIIRGNCIHDNAYVPGGIYLDEGSGYIEITGNIVYNVTKPMHYNNHSQNRKDTCNEHDNYFDLKPQDAGFPQAVATNAGLEPAYRDMLQIPDR